MKFINQKIGVFFWKLIVALPISFQNVLTNILFFLLKNPNLKRHIFSRKNIDAAFPNLNKQEKKDLFNKNLKSMIHGIFDTGKAWFWSDSKINSLIKYEIFGLNKLIATKGNLLIFKHSHHLELDSRILGMHCELYGVERVHNSPFMQKVQSMGRLKGLSALADKNSPITFIKFGTKLNISFGKMLSGRIFEILLPLAFIISLPPNKIEPAQIKRVKKIKIKPTKNPENQIC